jgi:NAD(P)-dependent dehydrogenase (short-subunit alcohol dehydrogenase family)
MRLQCRNADSEYQEVNVKGTFLVMKHFIGQLPSPESPAVILNLSTSGTFKVIPFMTGYIISKLAGQQLTANIAGAYPNITAVNVHPGLHDTDMYDFDKPWNRVKRR